MHAVDRRGDRVAVVIPVYNAEPWIKQTLDSVLSQSFQNVHIIVVDDGSTDRSREIIEAARTSSSRKFTLIQQKNQGVSSARNAGIRAATEDLIAFLDADDLWHPQKLELQLDHLRRNPNQIGVGCWYALVSEAADHILSVVKFDWSTSSLKNWLTFRGSGALVSSTLLVRRAAVADAGMFDENLGTAADLAFALRLHRIGPCGVVQRNLAVYRQHSKQMHRDTSLLEVDYGYLLEERLTIEALGVSVTEAQNSFHSYVALRKAIERDYRSSLRALRRVLLVAPEVFVLTVLQALKRRIASVLSGTPN